MIKWTVEKYKLCLTFNDFRWAYAVDLFFADGQMSKFSFSWWDKWITKSLQHVLLPLSLDPLRFRLMEGL